MSRLKFREGRGDLVRAQVSITDKATAHKTSESALCDLVLKNGYILVSTMFTRTSS